MFFIISKIQLHARILSSQVAQYYGHSSDLVVQIALRHRHVEFFGKANISIHGLKEDDTVSLSQHYIHTEQFGETQ